MNIVYSEARHTNFACLRTISRKNSLPNVHLYSYGSQSTTFAIRANLRIYLIIGLYERFGKCGCSSSAI